MNLQRRQNNMKTKTEHFMRLNPSGEDNVKRRRNHEN